MKKIKNVLTKLSIILIVAILVFNSTAIVSAKTATTTKTYEIFRYLGGHATDRIEYKIENGKIISSKISQSSKAVMLIFTVDAMGTKAISKTDREHVYESVYRVNIINDLFAKAFAKILKLPFVTLGYQTIRATYKIDNSGNFKVISVTTKYGIF